MANFDLEVENEYSGAFHFTTKYSHYDNATTMNYFIDNLLSEYFVVVNHSVNYAEIYNEITETCYAIGAYGNGDSFSHIIEYQVITKDQSNKLRNFLRLKKINSIL